MDMILNVFKNKGVTMSKASAYTALLNLNPNDPCSRQKAAGSLGGATRWGFLSRQGTAQGMTYTRTR